MKLEMFRLRLHTGQNVSEGFQEHVCCPQAEGILRGWATPALQKDYGTDPVVTKTWNTTMAEVQNLSLHFVLLFKHVGLLFHSVAKESTYLIFLQITRVK